MTNMMKKLGVRNRVEAARIARTRWGCPIGQSISEETGGSKIDTGSHPKRFDAVGCVRLRA